MAKMTMHGVTYEGTPEELRAIVATFEVLEEPTAAKTFDDFAKGDKVRLLSGGGSYPLHGFKDGGEYEIAILRDKHDKGTRINIENNDDESGYATPEQLEKIAQAKPELPKPTDKLSHSGADYALVQRKAQPGDVVVFTENTSTLVTNGKAYAVTTNIGIAVTSVFNPSVYRDKYNRTESNVLVYAPVAITVPLKVGDTVEVLDGSKSRWGDLKTGAVGKIAFIDEDYTESYRVDTEDDYDRFPASALRKVVAPVAEVKPKEADVFTKLGREKHGYKAGDIVKVIKGGFGRIKEGDIGVIVADENDDCPLVRVHDVEHYNYVELIAPVESRVDTK